MESNFKTDAKSIVDMLFDTKCFREDITRDSLDGVEEFISYAMESKFDMRQRAKELFDKIDRNKTQAK